MYTMHVIYNIHCMLYIYITCNTYIYIQYVCVCVCVWFFVVQCCRLFRHCTKNPNGHIHILYVIYIYML